MKLHFGLILSGEGEDEENQQIDKDDEENQTSNNLVPTSFLTPPYQADVPSPKGPADQTTYNLAGVVDDIANEKAKEILTLQLTNWFDRRTQANSRNDSVSGLNIHNQVQQQTMPSGRSVEMLQRQQSINENISPNTLATSNVHHKTIPQYYPSPQGQQRISVMPNVPHPVCTNLVHILNTNPPPATSNATYDTNPKYYMSSQGQQRMSAIPNLTQPVSTNSSQYLISKSSTSQNQQMVHSNQQTANNSQPSASANFNRVHETFPSMRNLQSIPSNLHVPAGSFPISGYASRSQFGSQIRNQQVPQTSSTNVQQINVQQGCLNNQARNQMLMLKAANSPNPAGSHSRVPNHTQNQNWHQQAPQTSSTTSGQVRSGINTYRTILPKPQVHVRNQVPVLQATNSQILEGSHPSILSQLQYQQAPQISSSNFPQSSVQQRSLNNHTVNSSSQPSGQNQGTHTYLYSLPQVSSGQQLFQQNHVESINNSSLQYQHTIPPVIRRDNQ